MALTQEIIDTFNRLFAEAVEADEPEPTAMTLATTDRSGRVSARIVLLKSIDERGFMFVTNYESLKASQLAQHNQAALCLLWKKVRAQVQIRVEGTVERTSEQESDGYFISRPRDSQIGAWASRQSQPLSCREELEKRLAEYEAKFHNQPVPRPPFWGGFRLTPTWVEFWYGAKFRLHERVLYEWHKGEWKKRLLYP